LYRQTNSTTPTRALIIAIDLGEYKSVSASSTGRVPQASDFRPKPAHDAPHAPRNLLRSWFQ
jgi:hypothetical protein